jgi:gamma-glutamylcyclotransferase (GGCT)/AIG2-like uncharacterized protein YtfP
MELLFSYGTLQQKDVQLSLFGRSLTGARDDLIQYQQSLIPIGDQEFVATSGEEHHAIARFTAKPSDRIPGIVFEVTSAELARADEYEPEPYKRVKANLASGKTAWVYVDARYAADQN